MNAAVHTASLTYFAKTCAHMGEGGSIPFMRMLLDMFPAAQFLVTGAAGPGSNMHAPNEFLHIDYSARITMCVAQVVATLATQPPSAASGEGASRALQVHYQGWKKRWDEWLPVAGGRLRARSS